MSKKYFEFGKLFLYAFALFGALIVSAEVLGKTMGSGDRSNLVNDLKSLVQPQNIGTRVGEQDKRTTDMTSST